MDGFNGIVDFILAEDVDDERQIDRWNKYAGEESGRYRRRLINMCIKKNKKYNDGMLVPLLDKGYCIGVIY